MLVGLFLRHFKNYKNINFIPISSGAGFTGYLGQNGAGKSSILEALDRFFNGGDWSINAQAKADGGISTDDKAPYIMPVFLIRRDRIEASGELEVLSDYLWKTNYKTVEALSDFYETRARLRNAGFSEDSHYLIAIGRQHGRQNGYLGSFGTDPILVQLLELLRTQESTLTVLANSIISMYAYFYIPVEADSSVFSALESSHVQKLLDEDIRKKIQTAIGAGTIGTINSSLQEFVNEISASLKEYEYKGSFKNRLTMNDLVEKVFEAYFSIKILHKSSGPQAISIRDMSAGEKRRALIDLAYSLLARRAARNHTVILAIDEPDASLHTSACHDQFSRLANIPGLTDPETQVLITTHWYGFLPIIQNGEVHAISTTNEKNTFHSFNLYNYREQIKQKMSSSTGAFPLEIELKSYNDMLQSIVASTVRDVPYNWILCEGLSDKIYLEYYLSDLMETANLRILPLGGFKEVRRVYEYLWQPLNDPQYPKKGKVLCLVDTDTKSENVELKPASSVIDFLRIVYDPGVGDAILVPVNDQRRAPATEIENALNASQFKLAAQNVSAGSDAEALLEILNSANVNPDAKAAYGYLDLGPRAEERLMKEYFDVQNNKVLFAELYTKEEMLEIPHWVSQIRDHFKIKAVKRTKRPVVAALE
jgi:predicted ATPase